MNTIAQHLDSSAELADLDVRDTGGRVFSAAAPVLAVPGVVICGQATVTDTTLICIGG